MKQSGDESRFHLMERLGRGGTAEVFRVRLGASGREAALKRPLPDPEPGIDFQLLASRELSLIGSRRFPGLVRILNQPEESADYLLLEICQGKTLDQLGQITDPVLALNLLAAVAADLEYLRQQQIIHGDLKPQNIFLPVQLDRCKSDNLFFAKLSDFSLGRYAYEPDSVRIGLGTVGYMAPETIIDSRASHLSDLFALGVIAYQMLTGKHPFIGSETDPMLINARVREEEPLPLEQLVPWVSKPLADLVRSLLSKSADQRPQTALAVCHSLRAAGASYPFEKLLRPKYLLAASDYQSMIASLPGLSSKQAQQLDLITAQSPSRLRLALESNFLKGTLSLAENGPTLAGNVYWPSRLRRLELGQFSRLSLRDKRAAVREAATGTDSTKAITNLLLPLLRPSTVRRLAFGAAPQAERENRHLSATQLYLRAGDLESADRCAYQAASLLRGEHRAKEAILCLDSVLDLASLTGKIAEVRELLMLRGDIQKEIGEVDGALATYQQLTSLYRDLPPDKLLAETYRDLGDLYKMKQDSKSGLDALNQAVAIYQQMGEEFELSRTYNNIGNSYFYAGDLAAGTKYYRWALRIQRRLKAAVEIASTLSNLGSVYCLKGKYPRSLKLLDISLHLKKELGNAGEIARTLNNLGYVHFLRGSLDLSVACLTESLEINRRIGSQKEILFNLENLTSVMQDAGQLRESLAYLEEGLTLAHEVNDVPHQFIFSHSMAIIHLRMGKPDDCRRALDNVFHLMTRAEDPQLAVQARLTASQLRLFLGDRTSATQSAREALELARKWAFRPLALQAMLTLLRIEPNEEYLKDALVTAADLGNETDAAVAKLNRVEFQLENDAILDVDQTIDEIRACMSTLAQNVDRPRLRNIYSELLLVGNKLNEAAPFIEQNRLESRKFGLLPEHAHALVLSGQLSIASGDIERAYADYRGALQILKEISSSIQSADDRSSFQSRRVVRFLVAEVRRLGKLLEQKQRAGSPALR